jgi:hypothetical protein
MNRVFTTLRHDADGWCCESCRRASMTHLQRAVVDQADVPRAGRSEPITDVKPTRRPAVSQP